MTDLAPLLSSLISTHKDLHTLVSLKPSLLPNLYWRWLRVCPRTDDMRRRPDRHTPDDQSENVLMWMHEIWSQNQLPRPRVALLSSLDQNLYKNHSGFRWNQSKPAPLTYDWNISQNGWLCTSFLASARSAAITAMKEAQIQSSLGTCPSMHAHN